MLLSRIRCATLVGAGLLATVGTASAHHLMGGKIPSTFAEGIASGLGHPIIGPDHLAFLVALGIAVGVSGLSFATPVLFLVAMACGVAAHVAAFNIPAAEIIVALSVVVSGVLLALDRRIPASGWAAIFGIAGFFHGYAYGAHWPVLMGMCVWFARWITSAMGVPVMDVMHVRMRMHESLVKMIVLVMFRQV